MSGRGGSGSFGSGRTAGYAIGEDRTSPWLEAIAGIRGDHVQAGLQARAGSPDPLRGAVRTSARVFTGSVPRLKTSGCFMLRGLGQIDSRGIDKIER